MLLLQYATFEKVVKLMSYCDGEFDLWNYPT
jgi:hypothetical protein